VALSLAGHDRGRAVHRFPRSYDLVQLMHIGVGDPMSDLLDLVYEYRRLLARRDVNGGRMSESIERRLLGLERLFGADPDDLGHRSRRRHARCEVRLPATIKIGDRVEPVDVVDIGGGGLRVEPAPMLKPGGRAQIRIVSHDTGRVYFYQVEAKWVARDASRSTMGLPFVGAPRQMMLAA
jgi:hypothetical protein